MRYLLSILCTITCLSAAPVPLFDGKSLAGWEGDEKVWRVEDGVIIGGSLEGNPRNEFLATERGYRNFRLSLEYKLVGTEGFVNGGVQFRSERMEKPAHEMIGYQADIGAGYSGFLYDESRRKKMLATAPPERIEQIEKPGGWNRYVILAEGKRIRLFLNGERTVDYIEMQAGITREGRIALQIHGDCKAVISFRNITIEELPGDLVPAGPEILRRFGEEPEKAGPSAFEDGKFRMDQGGTVVFTGQENMVRAQKAGFLESNLLTAFTDRNPRFRFMAWEGDTVGKQWRNLNFGSWQDQLQTVGATTVFAQFGQTESFDGIEGIPEFIEAYGQLLDRFREVTPRIVILSPTPFGNPGGTLPDLSENNGTLAAYVEAIRDFATKENLVFIDLFHPLLGRGSLTTDGWHLGEPGLRAVAEEVSKALGVSHPISVPESLRLAVSEKNRLFASTWRPANWSFVYGDRISQKYGTAPGDFPDLRETFEAHRPLIGKWEERIAGLVRGEDLAVPEAEITYPLTEEMMSAGQQQAAFTVADGYEVNLFADEKLGVAKPTQFVWDEKGRLWVACSPTYPQILPGRKPSDFILVLEDTDGDGQADKSWKFAEGLTMVQGLELGGGGLYVCDFDRLIHLRDTDGDGKADEEETILAGFGIGDTHQLINSLTYGPAGNLWFSQGLHAFSRVETPHGLVTLEKAGLWRLDPVSRKLEGFFNGGKAGHNCWGVAFDDFGQIFHKSGDRPAGYWSVPGLTSNPAPAEYHPVGPLFDTSPKTTALEFVGTAALPDELQGTAIIAGYFGNLVEAHRLEDSGSGFKSRQLPRLLKSSGDAFRPVDVSVGPDGAIYLADWFNPVIGHYQASYADPHRDRKHGRIWRLSAKNLPKVIQPDLSAMNASELIGQLRSRERWTRAQARRLLYNLPANDVVPALDSFVKNAEDGRILIDLAGLYQAHDTVRPDLLGRLLTSDDFRLRAYGARLLGVWDVPDKLGPLEKSIHDPHPRVRLEAVVALSYVSDAKSLVLALQALDSPRDPFLDYALAETVRALRPHWRPLPDAGKPEIPPAHSDFLKITETAPDPGTYPGKEVYESICLNCHQPEGKGLAGIYPPLRDSEWLQGDPGKAIRIILHGLTGPVMIGDVEYGKNPAIPMPPTGLSDQQAADVLTYLRRPEFENSAAPVTADEVEKIRAETSDRNTPWTADELRK